MKFKVWARIEVCDDNEDFHVTLDPEVCEFKVMNADTPQGVANHLAWCGYEEEDTVLDTILSTMEHMHLKTDEDIREREVVCLTLSAK